MKNAADKLASFVAKNGRAFEDVTRQKNPGDTLFKYVEIHCLMFRYFIFYTHTKLVLGVFVWVCLTYASFILFPNQIPF